MTKHNEAKFGEIAKTVVMPGDPLRAKYIAENYLDDYKLVNRARGMYAYTGKYKGKEITVMGHGMGIPSMGIYCYELYKIYDVENIIRIGSCGSYSPELNLFDVVLSENCYTESTFALTFNNDNCKIIESDRFLNSVIEETAKEIDLKITKGNTITMDCFDEYTMDLDKFFERIPEGFNPICAEMEAFALLYTSKLLNKKASCIMSVVDSKYTSRDATPEERETALSDMIKLALESAIKL